MIVFVPVTVAAVFGYSVLYRQWRRGRGVRLFVLATLPLAVLFLAAPLPVAMLGLVSGFDEIARTGHGGAPKVAAMIAAAIRPLLVGTFAMLTATCASAGFQSFAGRRNGSSETAPPSGAAATRGPAWILMLSSFVLVPGVMLAHHLVGTLRIISAASGLSGPSAARSMAAGEMSRVGSQIGDRLLFGCSVAVLLIGIIVVFAIANVVLAASSRETPLARIVSHAAVALVALSAASLVVAMAVF